MVGAGGDVCVDPEEGVLESYPRGYLSETSCEVPLALGCPLRWEVKVRMYSPSQCQEMNLVIVRSSTFLSGQTRLIGLITLSTLRPSTYRRVDWTVPSIPPMVGRGLF